MSFITATAAQRLALRNTAVNLGEQSQAFAQSGTTPTTAEAAVVQPYIDAAKVAIDAVQGTTGAVVLDGATVAVVNSANADSHNATATVTGTTLTNVKLPATVAFVDNTDTVVMQNSAGTVIAGTHTATVAAGAVSNVKLASTVAALTSGVKVNAISVTGTGKFATFTVVAGVITAIVLTAA